MLSLSFPSSFFKTENFDSCSCAQSYGSSRRQTEILASLLIANRLPASMMCRRCYVSLLEDGGEARTPLSSRLPRNSVDDRQRKELLRKCNARLRKIESPLSLLLYFVV